MNLLELARRRIDPALSTVLDRIGDPLFSDGSKSAHRIPARLKEAMRYALLSPGKRLRPALVIGGARAVGGRVDDVLPAACAVEMVHAYSLVHDDLPALDDDDIRRGQPTCHRAFDEATALLAGDALLAEAFALLADARPLGRGAPVGPRRRVEAIAELTRAAGAGGMVGGQYDDIAFDRAPERSGGDDRDRMISIHMRKTGRLIRAAAALGAIFGGGSGRAVQALRDFGEEIGLAFQLVDDVLDSDGVARLDGRANAIADADRLTRKAIDKLDRFGRKARPLVRLAKQMIERKT